MMETTTVSELIEHLQQLPQDALVVYRRYSEQCLLEVEEVAVRSLGEPRPDGWVQDARPDKPTRQYVVFPGN